MQRNYDVVVAGSGIAGSITALVLQQSGIRTLVVERDSHPRFAIGESTLPTTTFLLRRMAERYGIPELAEICSYEGLRKNGCAAWPKQIFWFGVHREGLPLETRHECVNEALLAPLGPDVHMVRSDVDAFLASLLGRYHVDYVEHAGVVAFDAHADHAQLKIRTPDGEFDVRAQLVVDATGHASGLARQLALRDPQPRLHTDTRSIFGHFRGARDLDAALGGANPGMRFRRQAGTQHHCFAGGWFWVIPFDNDITSVGLQLDRRVFPRQDGLSPHDEFRAFIERFPDVRAHLGDLEAVCPLVATDRIQFTSHTLLADRFIATPHAATFVEPLFSTGIMLTLSFIDRLAPALKAAHARNDWRTEQFRFVERLLFAEVEQIDRLVDGTIRSFRDYDLFKQYWRAWVIGTFVQYGCCVLADGATTEGPMLYGAGMPGFVQSLQRMYELVCDATQPAAKQAAAVKQLIDPWWKRLAEPIITPIGEFSLDSPGSLNVMADPTAPNAVGAFFRELAVLHAFAEPGKNLRNVVDWLGRATQDYHRYVAAYRQSKADGTSLYRYVDAIFDLARPGMFEYRSSVGIV